MTSGISSPSPSVEGDHRRRREAELRRAPAPHRAYAALAGLLFGALAAGGAEPTKPRDSLELGERISLRSLTISPDGKTLAVYCDEHKAVTLWDVKTKKQTAVLKTEFRWLGRTFAFAPDAGSLLVLGSHSVNKGRAEAYNLSVVIWDLKTQTIGRTLDFDSDPDTREAMFTPDGKLLIIGTRGDGVHVFDLESGKEAKVLKCDEPPLIDEVTALAVSADGKTLAVGKEWGSLFVFDLEKGELRQKIPEASEEQLTMLAFSPDGKRLVSGYSWTEVFQVWDPTTGKNLDSLRVGHAVGRAVALAFAPDGKTLAIGGRWQVELWDVGIWGFRDDFSARSRAGDTLRLAFSPDGKTLVTAGKDSPIEFWDVPAGAPKDVRQDKNPPPRGPFGGPP